MSLFYEVNYAARKILVVEDDREIGQLITTQLASLNLHVDHVVSAELALKK
ncbi:hypothetical protein ACOBV9_00435 [Pseudoalteromonas espejiana]